jgi:hypothetical protein
VSVSVQALFYKVIFIVLLFAFLLNSSEANELGLTSNVNLNVSQDSNVFRTTNEVDDNIVLIAPELKLAGQQGKHVFAAEYKGGYALYQDNDDLNYLDHDLSLKALFDLSQKFTSELSISFQEQIEQPGTTNALSLQLSEFNQVQESGLSAKFAYGTQQGIGQLVAKYVHRELEYTNNEQAFRDYDSDTFTGTFFYRIAPKTRLLLETSVAELNYTNTQFFDRSSKQNTYLAGVEWNATAITSSIFKIGYQEVDYDLEQLVDLSGLSYYLDVLWKPNTYSLVKIGASRAARESAEQALGGYISNEYDVSLEHEFTSNTQFSIGYQYTDFDFDNSQSRKDELKSLTAKLSYQSKHYLQFYAEYKNSQRESIVEFYNYDANIISLGAVVSFK